MQLVTDIFPLIHLDYAAEKILKTKLHTLTIKTFKSLKHLHIVTISWYFYDTKLYENQLQTTYSDKGNTYCFSLAVRKLEESLSQEEQVDGDVKIADIWYAWIISYTSWIGIQFHHVSLNIFSWTLISYLTKSHLCYIISPESFYKHFTRIPVDFYTWRILPSWMS